MQSAAAYCLFYQVRPAPRPPCRSCDQREQHPCPQPANDRTLDPCSEMEQQMSCLIRASCWKSRPQKRLGSLSFRLPLQQMACRRHVVLWIVPLSSRSRWRFFLSTAHLSFLRVGLVPLRLSPSRLGMEIGVRALQPTRATMDNRQPTTTEVPGDLRCAFPWPCEDRSWLSV